MEKNTEKGGGSGMEQTVTPITKAMFIAERKLPPIYICSCPVVPKGLIVIVNSIFFPILLGITERFQSVSG